MLQFQLPTHSDTWFTMSEVGKFVNIGRTKLYKILKDKNIVMANNEPYQQYINVGYFKYVMKEITNRAGEVISYQAVTLVSPKGVKFVTRILNQNKNGSEYSISK